MNLRRHRFVIVAVLVIGLLLAGRWALQPRDPVSSPAVVESTVATEQVVPSPQPPPRIGPTPEAPQHAPPPARDDATAPVAFRGRVIDAVTLKPVPEFTVALQRIGAVRAAEKAPEPRSFRTEDGRFEWRQHLPGEWIVTTTAHGYQRFLLEGVQISKDESVAEIVMPMRPGYTLKGRVYDEISGIGIAAADVGFREAGVGRYEGNWRMRVRVKTQEDGSFTLEGLPPARITLEVRAHDYSGRELDTVVDENTAPVEISLGTGGSVSGHLAASDTVTPVAGQAGLFDLDRHRGSMNPTGAGGEFAFRHLPAGRYRLSARSAEGFAERDIVLANNQRIEGIVLAMSAGGTIRGTVTGLKPEDLPHVLITAAREGDSAPAMEEVRVDGQGAYVLRGVLPGRLRVAADVTNRRNLAKVVEMPTGSDLIVNFDFPRGSRLSGHVTRGGKPVSGQWLQPRPVLEQEAFIYGVATAANGEYAIEGLATGEYNIWVEGYRSRTLQVSGDTVFDIDIPSAHLAGRIVAEGGKVPVVGAAVDVWPAQPDSPRIRLHDDSNDLGQFALTGLEPGQFMLTAYKPGYEMYRERVAYDAPLTAMVIRLRPANGVEIRVREAGSSQPVQSIIVIEMMGQKNGSRLQLQLDANGVGYLPGALAGSTLSIAAHGHAPAVVRDWDGQPLDLLLATGAAAR